MIELGTMLILGGCLVYSLFNALFFAFVYYRRRQLEREEGLALTEFDPHGDQHVHAHSAGPGALKFQVVPIERPLSHNAWLHEVAMRHLCSSSKLVAVKTLHGHNKDNDGGVEAGPSGRATFCSGSGTCTALSRTLSSSQGSSTGIESLTPPSWCTGTTRNGPWGRSWTSW